MFDGQSKNLGRMDQLLALGPLTQIEQKLLFIEWPLWVWDNGRHFTYIYFLI